MTRFTAVVISLIAVSLILAGQISARIEERNIMGAWLFDEGSGDVARDSSPNGNDGEVVGPVWVADGVFGSCLEFSGSADPENNVDCGADNSLNYTGTGEFSITAWVKVLTNDASYHNLISKKLGFNNTDIGWMAWLDFRFAGALHTGSVIVSPRSAEINLRAWCSTPIGHLRTAKCSLRWPICMASRSQLQSCDRYARPPGIGVKRE